MNNQKTINSLSNKLKPSLNAFLWVAVSTGLILLIPAIAMQLTDAVNWQAGDFVVMGTLLFTTGSIGLILWQKLKPTQRTLAIMILVLLFLYVWAELAVGVFTDIGS